MLSRLSVVSTRVGGTPEVLPPDLVYFSEPSVKGICLVFWFSYLFYQQIDIMKINFVHSFITSFWIFKNLLQMKEFNKKNYYRYSVSYLCHVLNLSVIDLVQTLNRAIEDRKRGKFVPPFEAHERIKKIYTWRDVAKRTEIVYNSVMNKVPNDSGERLARFLDQ